MGLAATGAGETDYLYLGDRLVGKYQPGSGNWTDMIYGNGSLIATVAGTQTAVPDYRFGDHLGSLAVLTDGSGNVLETNTFLPFGQQLSGGTLDPFLFTGLERESDTGTDRALYRQYDSTEDRWLTPDQYHGSYDLTDPQSFNRYAYVNGRPTFYTDPSGLVTVPCKTDAGALLCEGTGPYAGRGDGGVGDFLADFGDPFVSIGREIGNLLGFGPKFKGSTKPRPVAIDSLVQEAYSKFTACVQDKAAGGVGEAVGDIFNGAAQTHETPSGTEQLHSAAGAGIGLLTECARENPLSLLDPNYFRPDAQFVFPVFPYTDSIALGLEEATK